jgi:hypothetical protein
MSRDPAAERVVNGTVWKEFCDTLAGADAVKLDLEGEGPI